MPVGATTRANISGRDELGRYTKNGRRNRDCNKEYSLTLGGYEQTQPGHKMIFADGERVTSAYGIYRRRH